jgi:hypothetical protein
MIEPGTDHARAGGVKQNSTQPFHSCVPHCLFDLIADPGEHNVGKPAFIKPFYAETDRFAKTGSGQT